METKRLTYFAKYLPVKGNIKDGDKVEADGVIWTYSSKNQLSPLYNQDYRKVKLFLCSTDIKVGDKVKCISHDGSIIDYFVIRDAGTQQKSEQLWQVVTQCAFPESGYYINKARAFKVLGEVSSEATWVREEDEFDEEEIRHSGKIYLSKYAEEDEYIEYYLIKGPCGHYH